MLILYLNAQSIISKVDELASQISVMDPDLILVTESWCREDISDAFLKLPGYMLQTELRKDRADTANGIGGGLLVYAKPSLNVLFVDSGSDFNQHCSFKIVTETEELNFTLVYRPPNSRPDTVSDLTELVRQTRGKTVVIGDFNLPSINWTSGQATGRAAEFVQACGDQFLEQVVDFPTHIKGNTLDLILTNIPERFIEITNQGRLGTSDHCMILAKMTMGRRVAKTTEMVPNWRKADCIQIEKDLMDAKLVSRAENCTAEETWNLIVDTVQATVAKNVPLKPRRAPNKPAWMSSDILRALRRKKRIWRREKFQDSAEYREAEKKVKNLIRNAKRSYERKLARDSKNNSKPFYAYLKGRTKNRTTVGPLKNKNNETVTSSKEMAEELNNYFTSVFTREPVGPVPKPDTDEPPNVLEDVSIQQEEILKKIWSLRRGAAAGPDGIGPAFLQDYHKALVPALQVLFRKVLDEGVAPVGWRQANVTPIFKKGSKSDPGNYRPVSLTSVTCKVFESILRDNIVNHLESNKLLNASQHGFMRGKSCTTNLVEYLDLVTRALDEGKAMDTVFLDFAKAFDKVPTRRLLAKLEAHGVEGKVHRWIAAWLENREQRVVLNEEASTLSKVLSGVPQGSVLGPILFLIFINDIDQQVGRNTTIKKFADDTKLGKLIESNQDNILFQTCLDKLVDWADTWGMAFNISKCKVMHMGKNNTQYPYTMGGQLLKKTTSERDVGITVDNSGKPKSQCAKAAKTASVVLGQISRAFSYRDKKTFIRLYVQYVRPHLEFACQAWSPWTTKDVETL